eukprot:1955115-Amphidinium_carterae.1
MCESITGLGHATVVPYKGINQDAVRALVRFIVENGLQSTILQSDGEPAISDQRLAERDCATDTEFETT